jgi:hypothetical protein
LYRPSDTLSHGGVSFLLLIAISTLKGYTASYLFAHFLIVLQQISAFERRSVGKDSIREISLQGENSDIVKRIARKFDKEVRIFRATDPGVSLHLGAMVSTT